MDLYTFAEDKAKQKKIVTSRLYHLHQIGVGTSRIESLSSYIARLAEAHSVTPGILATREFVNLLGKDYECGGNGRIFFQGNMKKVNGFSPDARKTVQAIEYLTWQINLENLTMIPFSDVISNSRMFKDYQAWCPYCYEEWREMGKALYNPLIWHFRVVKTCEIHKTDLYFKCPNCKQQIPVLGRKSRIGYCPKCNAWLGKIYSDKKLQESFVQEQFRTQEWITNSIGKLLALAPTLIIKPRREILISNISEAIKAYTSENKSKSSLARALNVGAAALGAWEHGDFIPQLDYLLRICYGLQIDLVDIITRELTFETITIHSDQKLLFEHRVDIHKINQEQMENLLTTLLKSEQIPSIYEISKTTGHKPYFYKKNFPDFYKKIIIKHNDLKKQKSLKAKNDINNMIRKCMFELIAEGIYPTIKVVKENLGSCKFFGSGKFRVWRDTLSELGYDEA